jgi:hypothetical protein
LPSNLPREIAGSLRKRSFIRLSVSCGDVEAAFPDSREASDGDDVEVQALGRIAAN